MTYSKPCAALRAALSILFATVCAVASAQEIRGSVTDADTGAPLAYASVALSGHGVSLGAVADSVGRYVFTGLAPGRYDVMAACIGYDPAAARGLYVAAAHETRADIALTSARTALAELTVNGAADRSRPVNRMVATGGRMVGTDEAARYAGALDDPARLVSAYAGAQTNIGDNGIVIRGNAPKMMQWRLEGIEIPNPNHFGEVGGFGGGGLTALSAMVLGNSDFLTGAFPAEYGNALSGVFDLRLRTGSPHRRQATLAVGTMGADVGAEGPFRRGSDASYIFNYRYSTLSLMSSFLPGGAGNMRYQDLSFKLNFPTRRAGTFSVWGLGLLDSNHENAKNDRTQWEYEGDRSSYRTRIATGVGGLTHRIGLSDRGYVRTVLAVTGSSIRSDATRLDDDLTERPDNKIRKSNINAVLDSHVHLRTGRHTMRSGLTLTYMDYDMLLRDAAGPAAESVTLADERGGTALVEAFTDWALRYGERWTFKAGLHARWLTLNGRTAVEPRVGARFDLSDNSSVGLAYGLHSRTEQINYYFTRSESGDRHNRNLDFTRAHHIVATYDLSLPGRLRLRVEPYLQLLYSVPVVADSSLSLINLRDEWFVRDKFVNDGRGLNYGIDLTVERPLSDGFYWLVSGSVYSARYRGGDGRWHNTRYDRRYMVNALIGKEWMVGRRRRNSFNASLRLTLSGGNRYSPVNERESLRLQDVVFDETKAYSRQLAPAFWADFTVYYRINRRRVSHEVGLKMLNATFYSEYLDHQYNFKTNTVDVYRDGISMPNLYYKIEF